MRCNSVGYYYYQVWLWNFNFNLSASCAIESSNCLPCHTKEYLKIEFRSTNTENTQIKRLFDCLSRNVIVRLTSYVLTATFRVPHCLSLSGDQVKSLHLKHLMTFVIFHFLVFIKQNESTEHWHSSQSNNEHRTWCTVHLPKLCW